MAKFYYIKIQKNIRLIFFCIPESCWRRCMKSVASARNSSNSLASVLSAMREGLGCKKHSSFTIFSCRITPNDSKGNKWSWWKLKCFFNWHYCQFYWCFMTLKLKQLNNHAFLMPDFLSIKLNFYTRKRKLWKFIIWKADSIKKHFSTIYIKRFFTDWNLIYVGFT